MDRRQLAWQLTGRQPHRVTFSLAIRQARKALGSSQKDLAARVMKEEGGPISPQYLNDIEQDRRSPSSGHLIRQFSGILGLPPDNLFALAGRLPDDLHFEATSPDEVAQAFAALRRAIGS